MEPFCVILKRTLSSLHPLNQILKYHCRELTVPNTIGTPKLADEGQFMDLLFAYGNTGMLTLLRDGHAVATWEVTDLRAEIKVSCYVSSAVSALLFNPFNLKYLIDLFTDTAAISISPPGTDHKLSFEWSRFRSSSTDS